MRCGKCGQELIVGAPFCTKCGTKIDYSIVRKRKMGGGAIAAIVIVCLGFVVGMMSMAGNDKESALNGVAGTATLLSRTPSPTPTPTPTPNPAYSAIQIKGLTIGENMIGENWINPKIVNNYGSELDAVDFAVQCRNAYDDDLAQFGFSDNIAYYTYQGKIKPGGGIPKNIEYTLHGFDTATKFYVAIARFHTADGETIEIPQDQWEWKGYKKQ